VKFNKVTSVLLCLTLVLSGCQSSKNTSADELEYQKSRNHSPLSYMNEQLKKDAKILEQAQQQLLQDFQKIKQRKMSVEPVMPAYDPLEDVFVTLEMDNAPVNEVFKLLAKQSKMNLLLHPEVNQNPQLLSVSFEKMPASEVFIQLLSITNLYGEISNNLLKVSAFQEKYFTLDFLETNIKSTFNAGGDVLGTAYSMGASANSGGGSGGQQTSQSVNQGSGQSGGPISGNFSIEGSGPADTNPYTSVTEALETLVGEEGTYHLNKMTGVLYVKAKPATVSSIEELVVLYKKIIGRQLLVEARIMEVKLNDQHQAGVNWAVLRDELSFAYGIPQQLTTAQVDLPGGILNNVLTFGAPNISSQAGTSGLGVAHAGQNGLAVVNLLKQYGDVKVLSNPTIRARHGQPAMISVGQTSSYIKETDIVTTSGSGGLATTNVDVQVGTLFDGLMIGLIPFIGDDGKISLSIHPIQSEVDQSSLALVPMGNGASVTLPRIDLKEMSTTLEVNDQDMVLLGGLIDRRVSSVQDGVPGLSDIPLIGGLFQGDYERETSRELIVMLRVTQL
jgi:MSHA type pilus biogenesis protein MshL